MVMNIIIVMFFNNYEFTRTRRHDTTLVKDPRRVDVINDWNTLSLIRLRA